MSLVPEPTKSTSILTTPTPIRTTPTGAKRPRVDGSELEVQKDVEERAVPNGKEDVVPLKVPRVKAQEEDTRLTQKRVLVEVKVWEEGGGGGGGG